MTLADLDSRYLWLLAGLSSLFPLLRLGLLMPTWSYRARVAIGFFLAFASLVVKVAFFTDHDSSQAKWLAMWVVAMIALLAGTLGQGEEIRKAASHALDHPDEEPQQVRPAPFVIKAVAVTVAGLLLLYLLFNDF
ncbi:hypothetical protein [Sphaerisporangium fuscum]|uniref:hypothetical protein n=1 Tax=Sphaerisporangium fuscum TaxID=2835868 RepID=UPI001BDCA72C|nr:hypothetical protein [Sphaerisporangium fuscum]